MKRIVQHLTVISLLVAALPMALSDVHLRELNQTLVSGRVSDNALMVVTQGWNLRSVPAILCDEGGSLFLSMSYQVCRNQTNDDPRETPKPEKAYWVDSERKVSSQNTDGVNIYEVSSPPYAIQAATNLVDQ